MRKIYIASFGPPESRGLYVLDFDAPEFHLDQYLPTQDNPHYILRSDACIYTAMKNMSPKNNRGGVASYRMDEEGHLLYNDNYTSSGRSYVYLCLNADHHFLFAANYQVGTTASYLLDHGKVIKKISVAYREHDKIHHSPHVCHVGLTPKEEFIYSIDIDGDNIVLYDYRDGFLEEVRRQKILGGSGPSHMLFSPDGRFAYLVNQYTSTIMVFHYSPGGHFSMIQMISTLPRHFRGQSQAGTLHLSRSGRHLFVSNCGHDSIAMYARNPESGKLYLLYMVHTHHDPCDFVIDDDRYMYVICRQEGLLEVLEMDLGRDYLGKTEWVYALPEPVSVTI